MIWMCWRGAKPMHGRNWRSWSRNARRNGKLQWPPLAKPRSQGSCAPDARTGTYRKTRGSSKTSWMKWGLRSCCEEGGTQMNELISLPFSPSSCWGQGDAAPAELHAESIGLDELDFASLLDRNRSSASQL